MFHERGPGKISVSSIQSPSAQGFKKPDSVNKFEVVSTKSQAEINCNIQDGAAYIPSY